MSGARVTQRHVAGADDVAYAAGKGLLVPLEEVDDPRVGGQGWLNGGLGGAGAALLLPPVPARQTWLPNNRRRRGQLRLLHGFGT